MISRKAAPDAKWQLHIASTRVLPTPLSSHEHGWGAWGTIRTSLSVAYSFLFGVILVGILVVWKG